MLENKRILRLYEKIRNHTATEEERFEFDVSLAPHCATDERIFEILESNYQKMIMGNP